MTQSNTNNPAVLDLPASRLYPLHFDMPFPKGNSLRWQKWLGDFYSSNTHLKEKTTQSRRSLCATLAHSNVTALAIFSWGPTMEPAVIFIIRKRRRISTVCRSYTRWPAYILRKSTVRRSYSRIVSTVYRSYLKCRGREWWVRVWAQDAVLFYPCYESCLLAIRSVHSTVNRSPAVLLNEEDVRVYLEEANGIHLQIGQWWNKILIWFALKLEHWIWRKSTCCHPGKISRSTNSASLLWL